MSSRKQKRIFLIVSFIILFVLYIGTYVVVYNDTKNEQYVTDKITKEIGGKITSMDRFRSAEDNTMIYEVTYTYKKERHVARYIVGFNKSEFKIIE
jgi:hypothetical protein